MRRRVVGRHFVIAVNLLVNRRRVVGRHFVIAVNLLVNRRRVVGRHFVIPYQSLDGFHGLAPGKIGTINSSLEKVSR